MKLRKVRPLFAAHRDGPRHSVGELAQRVAREGRATRRGRRTREPLRSGGPAFFARVGQPGGAISSENHGQQPVEPSVGHGDDPAAAKRLSQLVQALLGGRLVAGCEVLGQRHDGTAAGTFPSVWRVCGCQAKRPFVREGCLFPTPSIGRAESSHEEKNTAWRRYLKASCSFPRAG